MSESTFVYYAGAVIETSSSPSEIIGDLSGQAGRSAGQPPVFLSNEIQENWASVRQTDGRTAWLRVHAQSEFVVIGRGELDGEVITQRVARTQPTA